jgi:hypothetical protein
MAPSPSSSKPSVHAVSEPPAVRQAAASKQSGSAQSVSPSKSSSEPSSQSASVGADGSTMQIRGRGSLQGPSPALKRAWSRLGVSPNAPVPVGAVKPEQVSAAGTELHAVTAPPARPVQGWAEVPNAPLADQRVRSKGPAPEGLVRNSAPPELGAPARAYT